MDKKNKINLKRLELLLFLFVIVFSLFTFTNIKYRQNEFYSKQIYSRGVNNGFDMGHKTTIKYLQINSYLPDTLHIDTISFKKFKKLLRK